MFNNQVISNLLTFIIIFTSVGGIFLWLLRRPSATSEASAALPQQAEAKVLQMGEAQTDPTTGHITIALQLGIFPPEAEAYQTEVRWRMAAMYFSQVQVGQTLLVKIAPHNPQAVLPAGAWAESVPG